MHDLGNDRAQETTGGTGPGAALDATALQAVIDSTEAALAALAEMGVDLDAATVDELAALARGCARAMTRLDAALVTVADAVDRSHQFVTDGFRNASSWLAHVAGVPRPHAAGVVRTAKAWRQLPAAAHQHRCGTLGAPQARQIARLAANPRCGDQVTEVEQDLLEQAQTLPFEDFVRVCRHWETLADEDGGHDAAQRRHDRRDVWLSPVGDGPWHLQGNLGDLEGAVVKEIFDAFVRAEEEQDWEQARAAHGPDATIGHLVRTPAQRRADAFVAMARHATTSRGAPPPVTVDIVCDQALFEHWLCRLAGEPNPQPLDPSAYLHLRCETVSGYPVHPSEAVSAALVGHVRRVVLSADGVTIDLGRRRRLFTGAARDAVLIQTRRGCCRWPGCHRPATACQIDHAREWSQGGATSPQNGDVFCGWHNRLKSTGYRVIRGPDGRATVRRPDGSTV